MGELIKKLGEIKFGESKLDIELNKGTGNSDHKYDIHIQNPHFRLSIPERDFLKMATAIIYASRRVEEYKRIEEDK